MLNCYPVIHYSCVLPHICISWIPDTTSLLYCTYSLCDVSVVSCDNFWCVEYCGFLVCGTVSFVRSCNIPEGHNLQLRTLITFQFLVQLLIALTTVEVSTSVYLHLQHVLTETLAFLSHSLKARGLSDYPSSEQEFEHRISLTWSTSGLR